MIRKLFVLSSVLLIFTILSCSSKKDTKMTFTGAKGEVKIMTLDPGHFHAALVQKKMYEQVSPIVHVYAPDGIDVVDHLNRIKGFNSRTENPTSWEEKVYKGPDFLEKMIQEKPGNVMVIAGKNKNKTEYLKATIDAGINVLSDKPMCINKQGFKLLQETFTSAEKNGVLLYDIMTERSEITTVLQKEFAHMPDIFGDLATGTEKDPAVIKESVHHFFKYVSGNPLKRPDWYVDVTQQGEGIVDVTSHLVDLVQWECFPEQIIDYTKDIEIVSAKRWPTMFTREQFKNVTHEPDFPDFLKSKLDKKGVLPVYANGEINYKIKGVHAKVIVYWKYKAPEGGADTHYSIMRGTKANVIIRQGKEQNYKPELFIETAKGGNAKALEQALKAGFANVQAKYPGIELKKEGKNWHILIPNNYRIGHEAHFGQVMERYLQYLIDGKLPEWEVPNMIAKYYTTTSALEIALNNK